MIGLQFKITIRSSVVPGYANEDFYINHVYMQPSGGGDETCS